MGPGNFPFTDIIFEKKSCLLVKFTSLSICATTFLHVEGLHNFEHIPPQLFLQSETFIHFMNAGNIIVSYQDLYIGLWIDINLERLRIAGEKIWNIFCGANSALSTVSTPWGLCGFPRFMGLRAPGERPGKTIMKRFLFILGGILQSFCLMLLFGEKKFS